jgi:UDP-N-acetylglucosamine--N-acetylmuramyl-(pentapeptide) pyrophosphoryl-undecaprenol N-acetylglucosamine transferase
MNEEYTQTSIRAIISGGGTGGHIFPAIAIARAIQARDPKAEILFVGALGKMEMEKIPQAGFKIIGLPIVGIQRKFTLRNLLVPFKIISSMMKARKIIREFKPDVAIGVGGYASGPLLRAAAGMGVKTLIQEQNSFPGITNRILSKKVDRICVAYEGLEKYFQKDKIILTGNPVRPEVLDISTKREEAQRFFNLYPSKKTILFVGGSLGARTINQSVHSWAEKLISEGNQIIWQTGKGFYQTAKSFSETSAKQDLKVFDFIREMDLAYAAADIIVSRAGAMSISELCLTGKAVVLVPSPNVSEDHQTKNAMSLVQKDAAVLLKDADAQTELYACLSGLLNDSEKTLDLSRNIALLGRKNAGAEIASEVFNLIHRS